MRKYVLNDLYYTSFRNGTFYLVCFDGIEDTVVMTGTYSQCLEAFKNIMTEILDSIY